MFTQNVKENLAQRIALDYVLFYIGRVPVAGSQSAWIVYRHLAIRDSLAPKPTSKPTITVTLTLANIL